MIYLYILLFSMPLTYAFDEQAIFDKANNFYQEGLYQEALSLYEKIDLKGPGVWHNLANCYWHLQQFKDAFFSYKRALKNASFFDQLLIKKQIAKSRELWVQAEEASQPPSLWGDMITNLCTAFQWQIIFFIMWIVLLFCIVRWRYRLFFKVSSCMVFVLLIVVFYAMACSYEQEMPHGVIIEKTKLFVAPKKEVHVLKDLSAGEDVIIVDSCSDWAKVNAQGVLGWVVQSDCQLL